MILVANEVLASVGFFDKKGKANRLETNIRNEASFPFLLFQTPVCDSLFFSKTEGLSQLLFLSPNHSIRAYTPGLSSSPKLVPKRNVLGQVWVDKYHFFCFEKIGKARNKGYGMK